MNSTIKRTLEVLKNDNWWRETTSNKFLVKTGLDLIEEALTAPTAEEVCEALTEYLKTKITKFSGVKSNDSGFYYYDEGGDEEYIVQNVLDCLVFVFGLPLCIVRMIVMFYEEEMKENGRTN